MIFAGVQLVVVRHGDPLRVAPGRNAAALGVSGAMVLGNDRLSVARASRNGAFLLVAIVDARDGDGHFRTFQRQQAHEREREKAKS